MTSISHLQELNNKIKQLKQNYYDKYMQNFFENNYNNDDEKLKNDNIIDRNNIVNLQKLIDEEEKNIKLIELNLATMKYGDTFKINDKDMIYTYTKAKYLPNNYLYFTNTDTKVKYSYSLHVKDIHNLISINKKKKANVNKFKIISIIALTSLFIKLNK